LRTGTTTTLSVTAFSESAKLWESCPVSWMRLSSPVLIGRSGRRKC
jgi:hypothetical protein